MTLLHNTDSARKATETHRIIAKAIEDKRCGLSVDDNQLARQYPHLMPELAEQLIRLRKIVQAAHNVRGQPQAKIADEAGVDEAFQEELDVLRAALSDYEFLDRVQHGGQGVVYKALHKPTKRMVAIKLLLDGPLASERRRLRFEREIELASRLRHSHIVTIFDCGVVRGRLYYTMEYIEGLPIDDYVYVKNLAVKEIARLFVQICNVVGHAHQRGIIHRDLKPSNLLVDKQGHPYILDFGLAKDLDEEDEDENHAPLSICGQVFGTLPYLSPEQTRGLSNDLDIRSDIYSIGVVLYQTITGTFPYPVTGNRDQVRNNILTCEPQRLAKAMASENSATHLQVIDAEDDIEAVIFRALEKDPERRYQSATALAEDLERCRDGNAVEAKSNRKLYVFRKTLRRYRLGVTIAAAFVIVLASGLIGTTVMWQRQVRIARIYQAGLQMGAYVKDGAVHRDANRNDQAIAMWEKAIEISSSVQSTDPVVNRYLYGAHHRLGEHYFQEGNLDQATPHCQAAVAIAEEQIKREQDSVEWERLIAMSRLLMGGLEKAKENFSDSADHYKEAIGLLEHLHSQDPENTALSYDLATAHSSIGHSYRKMKLFDQAKVHYAAALTQFTKLHTASPKVSDYLVGLIIVENKIAAWHISQHTDDNDRLALEFLERAENRMASAKHDDLIDGQQRDFGRVQAVISKNKLIVKKRLGGK